MNEVLMGIVVDVMALFGQSDDDRVDPDLAVTWLESISYKLQKLEPGDRRSFLAYVRRRADGEERPQMKEFLEELPEASGLTE
jgi:hypothetical protein